MPDLPLTSVAIAVITAVLAAFAVLYWRRWQAAERAAERALDGAAVVESKLAVAPLDCLAIAPAGMSAGTPGGATVHGTPALMAVLGLAPESKAALGALFGAFADADAERLSAAVDALRGQGSGFDRRAREPTLR